MRARVGNARSRVRTIPPVRLTRTLRVGLVLSGAVVALAPAAFAQDPEPGGESPEAPPAAEPPEPDGSQGGDGGGREPAPARVRRIRIKLKGVDGGKLRVGDRVRAVGKVRPYVSGQWITVLVKRDHRVVKKRKMPIRRVPGANAGRFNLAGPRAIKPGTYRVRANKPATGAQEGALAASRGVGVTYPDLDPGQRSDDVKLFNKLLAAEGYHTSSGSHYSSATGRAVLAFRKVNGMTRTMNANARIFSKLAAGKGGFKLKWPAGGKHVEVDLSRQVMALAKGGEARHVFHISSGTAATPTVRGKYRVYRFEPGFNNVGMYYSVYFHGGYATHGYPSVPTYPASHGCVRNPIPDSRFIYDWLDYGDVFYVYG